MKFILTASLVSAVLAVPQTLAPAAISCENPPAKGYSSPTDGGIFGMSGAAGAPKGEPPKGAPPKGEPAWVPKGLICKPANGSSFPAGPDYPIVGIKRINREGTGPYKSHPAGRVDPGLPGHTLYAPLKPPPADVKMPLIVFGEGGCTDVGTLFPDFLSEIASYGYLILASGKQLAVPEEAFSGNGGVSNQMIAEKNGRTSPALMTKAIDWVFAGNAEKYGTIDKTKVVAMGQSCGGIESYTASYHDDRVKQTVLLNSGSGNADRRCLFKELKAPVAYFVGGPCDLANHNTILDYEALKVEKFKAHIDSGHSGTYSASNGGKYGKAVVSFLQWRLRDDQKAKALWADPKSVGSFVSEGWYNITSTLFPQYESRSKHFNETYA